LLQGTVVKNKNQKKKKKKKKKKRFLVQKNNGVLNAGCPPLDGEDQWCNSTVEQAIGFQELAVVQSLWFHR